MFDNDTCCVNSLAPNSVCLHTVKKTGSLNLIPNFSENINIYEEGPYSIIVEGYYLLVMGAEDPMSY